MNAASPSRWRALVAGAAGLALVHILIDRHIGLAGPTSDEMGWLTALDILGIGFLFAWWVRSVDEASYAQDRGAALSVVLLAFVVSFLGHGIIGVAACPPPCDGAYPYQDLAHVGNVLVGGLAAWASWTRLREMPGTTRWVHPMITVALVLWTLTTSSLLALENV